ncbi:SH3 and F-BAR domain-containing protein DDB_G0274695 isoform X2 [Eupeodes corollae]|uniref:SH3 and F-BAR domain-containing protein DDB_G0274695 isoform X2 n=1 Tax=Eupeodes corollae TaxID=290404 RepID=UPI002490DD28|nr:SH3 and F-BAR domain-containing protein DDB_G0274695 isoform X2 [Eupeodes corollae]
MSQFRDNSWLGSSRSKSVLMSLRCTTSRSRSRSLSTDNLGRGKQNKLQQNGPWHLTWIRCLHLIQIKQGQNGFEELRRYIKQGGDFGKELILILQERVESEQLYSKSLSKMATKLNKACRELPGSIADAWRGVANEMESRSEIHRQLSSSLVDELVKPLKTLIENHHKTRKSVENNVDKSSRVLAEWRISEAKGKKTSHTAARENEKLQDGMLDVRIQKSPSIALLHQGPNKVAAEKEIKSAEKDCAKLDNKRRKAEEAVKRADVEYYTLCVRAERARVDWEMSVLRGSSLLQNVETQRLASMKMFVTNYLRLTANMNPILDGLVQRLTPTVESCNVQKDLSVIKNIRRIAEGPSEQLLPDFYCEHTTLAMNRERRKHALIKLLQLVKTDLERERRSRNGLKVISDSLNNSDNQNITDKLYHIRSMLTYLEGARFKLHSALLELDHKPRNSHPLAQHIQITRDRTGLQQSILKVPLWLKNNDKVNSPDSRDNEYDAVNEENGSCSDVKNDILVKHFQRSQSNLETISNNGSNQICVGEKANTIPTTVLDSSFFDRGIADGGSNQPDSDFDEFSSQDGDDHEDEVKSKPINGVAVPLTNGHGQSAPTDDTSATVSATNDTEDEVNNCHSVVISRCKALYSYTPKLYDELELNPGDIIEVHVKQEDGWWLGALRNNVGIFPATYVEEFTQD